MLFPAAIGRRGMTIWQAGMSKNLLPQRLGGVSALYKAPGL